MGALWLQEVWTFEFLPSVFKKEILTGLSNLRRKRCLNLIWYFMILPQKTFFQNIKIKLNSKAWMTLKFSVVIFQALKPLQPQWPQWPQQPQWPQWPQQPNFIKKSTDHYGLIITAPKWPITVPFCRIDHQKSNFSLISDSLSVGGCWGQPMSFFWKLVGETQIPKPPEATRNHNSIKSELIYFYQFTLIHPVFSKFDPFWSNLIQNLVLIKDR